MLHIGVLRHLQGIEGGENGRHQLAGKRLVIPNNVVLRMPAPSLLLFCVQYAGKWGILVPNPIAGVAKVGLGTLGCGDLGKKPGG